MTATTASVLRDQQGGRVQLGVQLGVGGQGAVYRVDGQADLVAKIYLQPPGREDADKLAALVRAATPALMQVSAWPGSLLLDHAGAMQGFLMPLVNAEFQELHLLYRRASRRQHFPDADWRFLVHAARNVTRAFGTLHQHGHLMGDVSSRNVMVSGRGTVRFIDTDSFQVREGTRIFTCPVGTAEFTPPELQGQRFGTLVRSEQHDLFGLALLLFHLLFEGRHPYAGVHVGSSIPSPAEAIAQDSFAYAAGAKNVRPPPGALPLTSLPPGLQALFERAFSPRHAGRPTAAEWDAALADLTAHLTACRSQPSHVHDRRVPCPWCELDRQSGVKTSYPGGARRVDVEGELNRIWRGVQAIPVPPSPVPPVILYPPEPFPLPTLPAANALPAPSVWAKVLGIVLVILSAYFLLEGLPLPFVFFLALGIWSLSRNSRANLARRREQQVMHGLTRQRTFLIGEAERHTRDMNHFKQMHAHALRQLQETSAAQRHREAMTRLEALRREIRELSLAEKDQLAAVIQREKQPLIEGFLRQQLLTPGLIPGIGSSLIQSLNAQLVVSAIDIGPDIHHKKGVGPKRAADLLAWRASLEAYFPFDPAKVPSQKLTAVQAGFDQQRVAKLQYLEQQVQGFAGAALQWREVEERAASEVLLYETEVVKRELTVREIQRLIVEVRTLHG